MKYQFGFTVEKRQLEQMIKNIKELIDENKLPNPSFDFQKLSDNDRCFYFLTFAIIGLFQGGFAEEKILETLEDLLEISVDEEEDLSPGNDLIH